MWPTLVLALALVVPSIASDAELLVERGEAAADQERWLEARALAMEALEQGPSQEAWALYLAASEGGGLGPMARAELISREDEQPGLAVWPVADRVRAGEAPLSELEAVAKENPSVGRLALAEFAWERGERPLARQLVPPRGGGPHAARLRLRFAVGSGDVAAANGVARAWLRDHPEAPDVLAELWSVEEPSSELGLLQRRILKRLRKARTEHGDDPLWLYRAVEVFAAAGEHLESRELASRIAELGYEEPLYRRPWSDAMLEGMGRVLGMRDGPQGLEGSWRERLDLTRSRVDKMRRNEDFDGAVQAWETLRAQQDTAEAALEQARLLQVLERYPEAYAVALEARQLATGPAPDDLGCLDTAGQAARLADAHGLLAELALSLGRVRTANEAVTVARALDPHPRWIALQAQVKVIPTVGRDPGLPAEPRVEAVIDTLVDATRSERWVARAQRHADAGERQAAFVSWVVARAYGATIGDALARTWDGVGPVDEAAAAALEAYHASRREHRSAMAEIRAEETGAAPILPTAVAPGPGLMLPRWDATALDGEPLGSKDLEGAPYILSIWASWCMPCLQELPTLDREVAALEADGVRVRAVAVSVDDRESVFRRRADMEGWGSLLLAWNPDLSATLGVDGLPTNFAIDAEGRILHLERGYSERGVARLLEAVAGADE